MGVNPVYVKRDTVTFEQYRDYVDIADMQLSDSELETARWLAERMAWTVDELTLSHLDACADAIQVGQTGYAINPREYARMKRDIRRARYIKRQYLFRLRASA